MRWFISILVYVAVAKESTVSRIALTGEREGRREALPPAAASGHLALVDTLELTAARIALIALTASLPEEAVFEPNRFKLFPQRKTLNTEAAAQGLAQLSKPVACSASAIERAVVLRCNPIPKEKRAAHELRIRALDAVWVQPFGNAGVIDRGPRILVMGPRDRVVVSRGEFRSWYVQYSWPDSVGVSERDPHTDEQSEGIKNVIVFARNTPAEETSELRILRDSLLRRDSVPPEE